MDWTVRGMDEATPRRAEAAAAAAGLTLSAWLDRTILANADSSVPPPATSSSDEDVDTAADAPDDRPDGSSADALADPAAQAAIQQALDALEARLDSRAANVASFVTLIEQKLDHLAAQPAAPLPPPTTYRRGLGLIAGALLLLSIGGTGGIAWLWFEMQEPPPNSYAEMDTSEQRQTLSPAAPAAMQTTPNAAQSPTETPASPPPSVAGVTPKEYADLEKLIAQSRAGTLAAAAAPAASQAGAPSGSGQRAESSIAQVPPRAAAGDAQLLAQLRASVAKNDAKAQHDLALLMMEGRLVPRDEKGASALFEQAAVQGLANAQYNLGVIYDNGIGRPADQTMAYFWYSAAADQGHIAAQYNLGVAAAQGKGAPRDYAVAALWFERAAKGGLPDAQYNLGQMHESGIGVEMDLQSAYDLYRDAAAQGYPQARQRMIALEGRVVARPLPVTPQRAAPATVPSMVVPPSNPTVARKDITEIQTLLRKLALLQGAADGNLGPVTRAAIRQYQTMAGLPATGEPTPELLQELREVAGPN